jgi:molybdate transport system substrate-binding protein
VSSVSIALVTSNATRSVLDELAIGFERASGHRIEIRSDSAKLVFERIRAGERADVAVLNAPEVDALVAAGILDTQSRRTFARSRIGVAVRAGTPHPDVSTVAALTRTLLDARTVAHTVHGASGKCVPALLERLGIAARVTTVTRPGGLIAKVVAAGEAEVAIQQISELLAVPGVEVVGPLPDSVQRVFESAAAVFCDTSKTAEASALLDYFSSGACAPLFQNKGLEQAIEA